MTTKTECYGCGGDCSQAYGTHQGYPYHFGCLPTPKRKDSRTQSEIEYDMLERRNWVARTMGGG